MRAAAILGLGCSPKLLSPFQNNKTLASLNIEWQMGVPAYANDADVILLFGGDGTIHRHLGPLVRLGLPVLIVPAGSGNDFARAIGLPRLRDSLAAWQKFCAGAGNVRAIDLGVISEVEPASTVAGDVSDTGEVSTSRAQNARETCSERSRRMEHPRYFCCVAGVGLDAEVARRANRLPRWLRAHGGYLLSLLPAIFQYAPVPIKISKPSSDLLSSRTISLQSKNADASWTVLSSQPAILAAFANTPTYGGGMKVAPKAKMDDGLLDVCIVGEVDPFKLFCMFPTVYGGKHLRIREVRYSQAARIRVETEHPLDVYADGEFVCRTPVEISIESAALKIVSP
jgi:diacylglycerol kinase (ATP)